MNTTIFPSGSEIKPGARVKFGIDPTLDRLHLGHFVPLRIVIDFIKKGHPVTIVLGTMTAQLGDPSGKEKTRPMLDKNTVKDNSRKLREQIGKLLPPNWSIPLQSGFWENGSRASDPVIEFLKVASHFTVDHMMSRDAFQKRKEKGNPVALHELMVPILQGLDSVFLESEVEIGGQDQLFNFQVTRKLQEMHNQKPEVCVMCPIINGTDGRKMSKSLGNCIFLDESPQEMFGKIMSISDTVMEEWLPLFTDTDPGTDKPMERKIFLAVQIVGQIHNPHVALEAWQHFQRVIQNKELPEVIKISATDLLETVVKLRNCSKSEGRRLILHGGVKVNGDQILENINVKPGDIIRVGTRTVAQINE